MDSELVFDPVDPVDAEVGARLRTRRVAIRMSRDEFAALADATVTELEQWETGARRVPVETLQRMAKLLDVPPAFFFMNETRTTSHAADAADIRAMFARTERHVSSDGERLSRAFDAIDSQAIRELAITVVEMLATGNFCLH